MSRADLPFGDRSSPAPPNAWRVYDRQNLDPGYFEFNWISARHPDLYHRFALSIVGLMDELRRLVDLTGMDVVDIGAGIGQSTLGAARTAEHVYAVDAYRSVVEFGGNEAKKAGLTNVTYLRGDSAALPLADRSVDVALVAFAAFDPGGVYRVLEPGGRIVYGTGAPGSLMGEMTDVRAPVYPDFVTEIALREWFDPGFPPEDADLATESWEGIPVRWMKTHDFAHVAEYGDPDELAAIVARIYGPVAEKYVRANGKSTLAHRLRIYYGQVAR